MSNWYTRTVLVSQEKLHQLGFRTLETVRSMGAAGLFLGSCIARSGRGRSFYRLLIAQLFALAVLSLPIILVSALFIGMVLGLQGHVTLIRFGAEQALGQLVALSLIRELGPVVSALLYAGRAGSSLTAEIALMKTTEQLSSLEMMGVDPFVRVMAPRWWAGQLALPMLTLIFNTLAILGGYWIAVFWLHGDGGAFWSNMQSAVDFRLDVMNSIVKSMVFAFFIHWVALYQGFAAAPTAEGMAYATTRTVVYASLLILGIDFVLTAVMFGGMGT